MSETRNVSIDGLIATLKHHAVKDRAIANELGTGVRASRTRTIEAAVVALAAERDRADRAEARLALIRDEASAFRQASKTEMVPVASVGVLLLALIDSEAAE